MLNTGTVSPFDMAWCEGYTDWVALKDILDIKNGVSPRQLSKSVPALIPARVQTPASGGAPVLRHRVVAEPIENPSKTLSKWNYQSVSVVVFLIVMIIGLSTERRTDKKPTAPHVSTPISPPIYSSNYPIRTHSQTSPTPQTVECNMCVGAGRSAGTCWTCRGQGTIKTPSGFLTVCSKCGGSGQIVEACWKCGGRGGVEF